MHLLRLSEVEIGVNDRVFRHARLRALLLWLAAFCGDAAMFFSAVTGKWKSGYIFGPALLLFLLLFLRYIELELAGDTASLASALQLERSAKPLMKKHWYGSGSTLYRDYPLTMGTPPFLRIRWDVVPRAARFLAYLRQYTRIADPVSLKQDFTRLQSLSHEEQQKQLRDLAVRGEVIAAIYIARKLYGFSMPQAKMMVDR